MERDLAGSDGSTTAMTAGFSPAPVGDASHVAVPGEPGSGRDRRRLASPL